MYKRGTSTFERLQDRIFPEPNSGCWIWSGCAWETKSGMLYGVARHPRTHKTALVHRIMWEIARGQIPDDLQVLHRCDVPLCVNPDHLFLGTNTDNVADKVSKGRQSAMRGRDHPNVILTEDQVQKIRKDTRMAKIVAAEYGVSHYTIHDIRWGRSWKHIPWPD